MKAYRTYLTITDPKQTVLQNLPFQAGERVEILVLSQDVDRREVALRLEELFKQTQALPQAQGITEGDIVGEIRAVRGEP